MIHKGGEGMGKRIAVVGAGAVGGYVGGRLADNGEEEVILIDQWPENVDYIKANGIHLSSSVGDSVSRVQAMHLHEVQGLIKTPIDIALICTKSYDTDWAATLIRQYLAPEGFVVSIQNSINEERIAQIVGWGKTVGCIVSGIGVDIFKPGNVRRTVPPGGAAHTVFRVGEVHGRETARAEELARIMSVVDSAKVTRNLWGERWTKLIINSMNNAASAATGLSSRDMVELTTARKLSIRLGGEAIQVGQALGYELESIRGIAAQKLLAAASGNTEALNEVEDVLLALGKRRTGEGRPSTAQDIIKGRRTEIDFINGLVVQKAKEAGLKVPANEAITALVKKIESGEVSPNPENINEI
jgi:2-dehydropantoate 2-reductase